MPKSIGNKYSPSTNYSNQFKLKPVWLGNSCKKRSYMERA